MDALYEEYYQEYLRTHDAAPSPKERLLTAISAACALLIRLGRALSKWFKFGRAQPATAAAAAAGPSTSSFPQSTCGGADLTSANLHAHALPVYAAGSEHDQHAVEVQSAAGARARHVRRAAGAHPRRHDEGARLMPTLTNIHMFTFLPAAQCEALRRARRPAAHPAHRQPPASYRSQRAHPAHEQPPQPPAAHGAQNTNPAHGQPPASHRAQCAHTAHEQPPQLPSSHRTQHDRPAHGQPPSLHHQAQNEYPAACPPSQTPMSTQQPLRDSTNTSCGRMITHSRHPGAQLQLPSQTLSTAAHALRGEHTLLKTPAISCSGPPCDSGQRSACQCSVPAGCMIPGVTARSAGRQAGCCGPLDYS